MLNPHEETWTAHKDCVVMPEGWRTILRTHEDMLDGQERERAQLAAQAPAMARLLLEIHGDHEQMAAGRYDALEAVLRAAGVLP